MTTGSPPASAAHLLVMTDQQSVPVTTGQALATYDHRQRALAAAANIPTARTALAGLTLSGSLGVVVYTAPDNKVRYLDMAEPLLTDANTASSLVTFHVARKILDDAYDLADPSVGVHRCAIFADPETLRRLTKMAASWSVKMATQEARMLSRLLEFRGALPTSTFTPVLTDALASRYWLPSGPATDDLAAWASAFGQAPATYTSYSYLIARALDGQSDSAIIKTMTQAERFGVRAGQYGSDHAACSAFTKAGSVTDAFAALLSLDPVLRERNAISGAISKVRIHQVKANKIEAYVDDPGKLREGSKVLIFDGVDYGNKVEVTLETVDFINDTMMATFSVPKARDKNAHIIEDAKAAYRTLYVATAPFLSFKRGPKNRRWTSSGEEKTLLVDMPVDIALAGAPLSA